MCDDWDDNEDDWADDYEEFVGATGGCPECGAEIDVEAEACPSCGYWLTTAERHTLWDGGSQVKGMMGVGKVALVVILIALMSGLLLL